MLTEKDRMVFDFYNLMFKDEAPARFITRDIISEISQNKITLQEWLENALTYHSMTPELQGSIELNC